MRALLLSFASSVLFAASPGTVYTMTNWSSGNQVIALARDAAGRIGSAQFYATGGAGTGFSLGSQGSIAITPDGRWLIVVNAASNDISVFSIAANGTPNFASRTLSLGFKPVSLAVHGNTVFVLNAAPPASLSGFTLTSTGSLTPIAGALRVLTGSDPVEIAFDASGAHLVITDRQSNLLETFGFSNGRLSGPIVTTSAGASPSGFGFAPGSRLVVAQALTEAPNASAVSSYQLDSNAHLKIVSRSVPTAQTGALSVAVTNDGKFAFVGNSGSASISSLGIAADGTLRAINLAAGLTFQGTSPADLALSPDNTLLYAIATGTIFVYSASAGRLTPVTLFGGLPTGASGLAIR